MARPRFSRQLQLVATLTCFAIAILLTTAVPAHAEHFVINHFHADISVQPDGTVRVVERIDLTFERARHGIYREIPVKYTDALGKPHRAPIKVKAVKDEFGASRTWESSIQGNVINIRIGDADKYVNGRQVYSIAYEVENILLFLDDRDELYWNVTGDRWDVPIDSVSATVRLDSDKPSKQIHVACYTGRYSSKERECTAEVVKQEALFRSTRGFGPREGLTIAVGWDKGLITPLSQWQQMVYDYNLDALWVFIFPIVVLIFMFYHWRARGRDPIVHDSITVQYGPPSRGDRKMTAAEVGTLIDERLDPRDISAAIVGLASKGYITIKENEEEGLFGLFKSIEYDLIKQKDADDAMTEFERYLYDCIFEDGERSRSVSSMKNKFYKHLPTLQKTMYSGLTIGGYFQSSPEHTRGMYVGAGVVVAVLGFLAAITFTPDTWAYTLAASILAGVIVVAFANAMPAKTRVGASALDHIRGFQEFMNRADKDRIERLGKGVFYEYMPYAIALGVTDQWAKAFAGMMMEPPGWYVGSSGMTHFSPVFFARSMGAATEIISAAAYSSPRGSSGGSSGGGFSGGGGGGGGGGSW